MPKTRNAKAKIGTKKLINLAMYALLLKKPYNEISVKEICYRAGVSRMSFYRYFSAKDDVIINVCDFQFENFYEKIKVLKNPTWEDVFLIVFYYFKSCHREVALSKRSGLQYLILNQLNSYMKYIINNVKSEKIPPIANANKVAAPFLAGGFFMILMDWIERDMEDSPEELRTLFVDFIEKSLKNTK